MTKRHLYPLVSLIVIVVFLVSACSGGRNRRRGSYKIRGGQWTISKIEVPRSKVKLVVNDKVKAWLKYYTGPGRERFERHLARSGRYIPLMKNILKEHGLPEEVVYIALIESGFVSNAHSHAGAVGFWQFIRSTGRHFDLRIDPFVDERMDFIKSTHAAANYLTYLYNMFGDWHLAFAGYNAGEGKVGRAIKTYGTKDFWKLTSGRRRYLRPETRDYVPKYIAATIIASNPRKYGIRVKPHDPLEYEEIKASTQTDHEIIAKCSGSDYETISLLNPELIMGVTPPGEKNYNIRVPKGKGSRFLRTFAKLPKHKRIARVYKVAPQYHVVGKGETLSKIARKYKVSTRSLMSANKIRNSRHLKRGQRLKIPGQNGGGAYSRPSLSDTLTVAESTSSVESGETSATAATTTTTKIVDKIYKIEKGDTLFGIAKKHGVKLADLKEWNGMTNNVIHAGKTLTVGKEKIAVPAAETQVAVVAAKNSSSTEKQSTANLSKKIYKIKKGDTIGQIAEKHGVKVADLRQWNNIKGNRIVAGRKLKIYGDRPESEDRRPKTEDQRPETKVASQISYTVKSGDTLYGIAKKNKISIAALCKLNNMSRTAVLRPGKELVLKGQPAASTIQLASSKTVSDRLDIDAAATTPVSAKEIVKYKVKKGDTAWNIAREHNISLKEIKSLNGDTDLTKIKPGDIIKIKFAKL